MLHSLPAMTIICTISFILLLRLNAYTACYFILFYLCIFIYFMYLSIYLFMKNVCVGRENPETGRDVSSPGDGGGESFAILRFISDGC